MSPKEKCYSESVDDVRQMSSGSLDVSLSGSPTQAHERKKIQFKDQPEVEFLSTDETESRTQYKEDIWYLRSELVTMRKNDRQSLLLALRNVATSARERATASLQKAGSSPNRKNSSPPPPPPLEESPSEFCFRGMEIILYKREREECRRKAMHAVMTEQHRQRLKENERQKRGALTLDPPEMQAQQQISIEYKLMTRQAYDDAYLRGLGDAQEARTIFRQSLHFPSVRASKKGNAIPKTSAEEESKNPESPSSAYRRETYGDDLRDAPAGHIASNTNALSDLLSQKMILQNNSQLKSVANTNNPATLRLAAKYQSDAAAVTQSWNGCVYNNKI